MDEERRTVLVVDDDAGMRDMLRWALDADHFDVVLARDGVEAAERLASGRVDLVVTDITMPRLGGFDLLEAAAATVPRTPVIMMTGFGTVEMAVHAMRRGASDFLLKPFDTLHLAARIRETLSPRPTSPATAQAPSRGSDEAGT